MRQKIGFVLLLVIVFTAAYLRPLQEGAPERLQAYTYQQIVGALEDAGLEPSLAVAGSAGGRALGIPAREHHRLTIGQTGIDIFLLPDGVGVRSTEDGLVIERLGAPAVTISADVLGERYAMHRANLLLLLDAVDPSETAQIIEALARLH